jgi:hypothetical protein
VAAAQAGRRLTVAYIRTALVLGVCLSVAANAGAALADQFTTFVQIACMPELHYFSIRRFGLPLKEPPPETGNRQRIYTRYALEKAPAECDLQVGAETVRIRALGIYDDQNKGTSSYRFIVDKVEVSANGKRLDDLFMNAFGFLAGIDFLEVIVNGPAVVRRCAYYDHPDNPALKAGCTTEELP